MSREKEKEPQPKEQPKQHIEIQEIQQAQESNILTDKMSLIGAEMNDQSICKHPERMSLDQKLKKITMDNHCKRTISDIEFDVNCRKLPY